MTVSVLADLVDQVELELVDDLFVAVEKRHVASDRHLHAGLFDVLDQGFPVGRPVDPRFEAGEVVLGVGVLDVREQLGLLPGEEEPSAHQIPDGGCPFSPLRHS